MCNGTTRNGKQEWTDAMARAIVMCNGTTRMDRDWSGQGRAGGEAGGGEGENGRGWGSKVVRDERMFDGI